MAINFILVGYQALKGLFLADATLMAATRKKVWFDGDDPHPEHERKHSIKQAGDVAEFKLDWESFDDSNREETKTFGNSAAGNTCPFIEVEKHIYVVTVMGDNESLIPLGQVISHVERIIRANPTVTVGADAIARTGRVTARNEKTTQDEASGHWRRVAKIRIPLNIYYTGTTQTS